MSAAIVFETPGIIDVEFTRICEMITTIGRDRLSADDDPRNCDEAMSRTGIAAAAIAAHIGRYDRTS